MSLCVYGVPVRLSVRVDVPRVLFAGVVRRGASARRRAAPVVVHSSNVAAKGRWDAGGGGGGRGRGRGALAAAGLAPPGRSMGARRSPPHGHRQHCRCCCRHDMPALPTLCPNVRSTMGRPFFCCLTSARVLRARQAAARRHGVGQKLGLSCATAPTRTPHRARGTGQPRRRARQHPSSLGDAAPAADPARPVP
jgi:hypothetical protein